jgi:hypothetical protein
MRSGSGPGTFFAATYLLKAATLKPSFFAACRMENELIGNIVPDNFPDVKRSSGYNRVVAKDVIHTSPDSIYQITVPAALCYTIIFRYPRVPGV